MPKYDLLYNRLTDQNIGPDVAPAYVEGDNPKEALKATFGYTFRRVYDEAAKSPDIVLYDERGHRRYFIAVSKVPVKGVRKQDESRKVKDEKTHRYVKRKN